MQVGVGAKTLHFKEAELGKYGIVKFNIVQIFAHVISWLIVALILDLWWYAEPLPMVLAQGFSATITNSITTAIVGGLLCVAYTAVKTQTNSSVKR